VLYSHVQWKRGLLPCPVLHRIWRRVGHSPASPRMSFRSRTGMEQPTSQSIRRCRSAAASDQGETPRSTTPAPQVSNICHCHRFYLQFHQVLYHRKPTDQGARKVTRPLGLHRLQKAQQIFVAPVVSHLDEVLEFLCLHIHRVGSFDILFRVQRTCIKSRIVIEIHITSCHLFPEQVMKIVVNSIMVE
jgi:hypothetical protein